VDGRSVGAAKETNIQVEKIELSCGGAPRRPHFKSTFFSPESLEHSPENTHQKSGEQGKQRPLFLSQTLYTISVFFKLHRESRSSVYFFHGSGPMKSHVPSFDKNNSVRCGSSHFNSIRVVCFKCFHCHGVLNARN